MSHEIHNPGKKVTVNGQQGTVSQTGEIFNSNGTVIGYVKPTASGNRIIDKRR